MKKRTNLALAAFLLGGIATVALPTLGRIMVLTGIALVLYMTYDEFSYDRDHKQSAGGTE